KRLRSRSRSTLDRFEGAGPQWCRHGHARALWHQPPGIALIVHLRRAGAGRARTCGAVVHTFEGDAVALLLRRAFGRRGCRHVSDHGGKSARQRQRGHGELGRRHGDDSFGSLVFARLSSTRIEPDGTHPVKCRSAMVAIAVFYATQDAIAAEHDYQSDLVFPPGPPQSDAHAVAEAVTPGRSMTKESTAMTSLIPFG